MLENPGLGRQRRLARWTRLAVVIGLALMSQGALAALWMPGVFGDHMVLQRGGPIPVWGTADAGQTVQVRLSEHEVSATADQSGRWRVDLPTMEAGGPHQMVVTVGEEAVTFDDVLIGEVWLCSGQSNMQWSVARSANAEAVIASAGPTRIRHLNVPRKVAVDPQADQAGRWEVCSSEVVGAWSAVAYAFALRLHEELDVPVGLLNASWGGTLIEPWTSKDGFAQVESLSKIIEGIERRNPETEAYRLVVGPYLDQVQAWVETARLALDERQMVPPPPAFPEPVAQPDRQHYPTVLYNGMIHPLVPYAIRGAIWYQGESNRNDDDYVDKTVALVGGWRQAWGADFPYYYVQIAPFQYGQDDPEILARFWEQQARIEQVVPNSAMVVINDIGNLRDIHPANKHDVGLRLANLALSRDYGKTDLLARSPVLRDMRIDGRQIHLTFDHAGTGMVTRDGQEPNWFEVIGPGTGWHAANARITAPDQVTLESPNVPKPTAVRFAWHKLAEPNLANSASLPLGAFRFGTVPSDTPAHTQPQSTGD